MKILITVNTYYPLNDGVQNVTEYLAEGLAGRGHEVTVLTPSYGACREEMHCGVRICRVEVYVKHAVYYGEKKAYVEQAVKMANESDVMINVCAQIPMTDLLLGAMDRIHCRKVLHMHGRYDFLWREEIRKGPFAMAKKLYNDIRWGWLYNAHASAFRKYDHVIVLHETDSAARYFRRRYGIEGEVLFNAADDAFFCQQRQEGEKYFLYIANYLPGKNQQLVLRAFLQADLDPEYRMVFIGSDESEEYAALVRLYEELCPDHSRKAEFLTGIPRSRIPSYVANASLFLMGSDSEKFPMVIVEAMACGVPYISTDVGCLSSFPGGILVHSAEEMAEKIQLLMGDPAMYSALSRQGRQYADENFRMADKVAQLEQILQS